MKEPDPKPAAFVSVHGGHSGQFCNHVSDALEKIVRAYVDRGFEWMGITEHIPPVSEEFLFPEETEEEAGISIRPADLEFISVMHRKSDEERIDFFFTAGSWGGEIVNREPRKCDELAWFPLDDFPEYMVSYVRRALMNHRDGRWFDSFGWT